LRVRIRIAIAAALAVQLPEWRPSFEPAQPDLFSATGGQANAEPFATSAR
jgi:hypothetical protein